MTRPTSRLSTLTDTLAPPKPARRDEEKRYARRPAGHHPGLGLLMDLTALLLVARRVSALLLAAGAALFLRRARSALRSAVGSSEPSPRSGRRFGSLPPYDGEGKIVRQGQGLAPRAHEAVLGGVPAAVLVVGLSRQGRLLRPCHPNAERINV